eukprot:1141894-Pelagomonas_calceolata.AAC.5
MAIGRGQGASADKLIRNSVRDPVWVVLENTHLAGDYMPQLCSLVQVMRAQVALHARSSLLSTSKSFVPYACAQDKAMSHTGICKRRPKRKIEDSNKSMCSSQNQHEKS